MLDIPQTLSLGGIGAVDALGGGFELPNKSTLGCDGCDESPQRSPSGLLLLLVLLLLEPESNVKFANADCKSCFGCCCGG